MASLDVRRPAAMEQLAVLGRDTGIDTLPIVAGQTPPQIANRALEAARLGGYDVVMLDTAGRTTLDEAMMSEAAEVKPAAEPTRCCWSPMRSTGQDAVILARAFHERVGLTGIVLTRVDGDGRGGAALSMRSVTGMPIKLIGTGEKLDALDDFDPARIAGRILGMGDVVALVEKAAATIDAEKAARMAEKMRKGEFDLGDLREQLTQMQAMGGMSGLMGMLPGIGKIKNQLANANIDETVLKRQMAIIELDDTERAAQPRHPQAQPQEAHRRRVRHAARGHQPPAENASFDGRRDEGDGQGQRGPMAGMAQAWAWRRRHAQRSRSRSSQRNAGRPARRRLAAELARPARLPPNFPGAPGFRDLESCRADCRELPGGKKK